MMFTGTSREADREDQADSYSGLRAVVNSRATARREIQLLLACARTTLDPETATQIKNLAEQELDWKYLFKKANENFVTPLLSFHVLNVCPQSVPQNILDELSDFFRAHAQRNLFQTNELIRLLRLLDSHGIRALPFKGPTLAALAYGNLSLRQFGDLDILVRERDLKRAVELFTSAGYRTASPLDWSWKSSTPANRQKDLVLVRDDGRVSVELHWRLLGSRFTSPHNMKRIWKRTETTSIAGSRVYCLPKNELLLYLCMHGSKHHWERIQWISDIAELVRTIDKEDWPSLLQHAKAVGCERVLALGLLLASNLLEAPVPEKVLQKIRSDATARSLAAHARSTLFSDTPVLGEISNYSLKLKERRWDKVRLHFDNYRLYIRRVFKPNEKDRALLPLPVYLFPLYYLVRPIRLIKCYGRSSWNKFVKHDLKSSVKT
jgi:hypothetical protein